jgi:hypothetical protein
MKIKELEKRIRKYELKLMKHQPLKPRRNLNRVLSKPKQVSRRSKMATRAKTTRRTEELSIPRIKSLKYTERKAQEDEIKAQNFELQHQLTMHDFLDRQSKTSANIYHSKSWSNMKGGY